MTPEELSNSFDTLINSYSGIGQEYRNFDEYEKSIFLTKAQEEILESLYTGKALGDSFESTEQLRRYLADLIVTDTPECIPVSNGISNNSYEAALSPNVWFITYESAVLNGDNCINNKEIQVIPVTQDEYHRIKNNPFRKANSRKVLRLDLNNSKVELISEYPIKQYLVRYIQRPTPIILTDLPEDLTIYNQRKQTECNLNPSIYRMILDVAVNMAIQSRSQNASK